MHRRGFLRQVSFTAGVLGFSALPFALARLMAPEVAAAPHRHIPLPGALTDAQAFREACIGCGLCGEVCPPRCVRFHSYNGGRAVNTPYINPEEKSCTLCGLCMKVCPTAALRETPIREVRMGIAQIDRAACYPWVDKGVCGACVSVCPLGDDAIGFQFGNLYRPAVREGCVGCGQCVEVCPHPSLPIRIVKRPGGTVVRHPI
ncbi:MAG: 4Fe-4S dicluster domain-containing protein [Gammaproteobacteria bacterium]|nr:4Fe-4S dicluster domain-containing protein [Gammaproteobacteria bacterium]NIR98603.1 4Fe-4S dicluster domain-containing protein [Gammaproteobacteria bacterium]NIT64326.1 4Fe-4S dicluster domain-containing protein [Gammaproteobacteria bacterium]NIV21250.1 4Fe-4S dicluster domain-containing protein [Gammaproteobacteria bacterium]NIX10954.1 4Fe-4S dicluster domain-containing protein [Gammaproteobacteria bacterium]